MASTIRLGQLLITISMLLATGSPVAAQSPSGTPIKIDLTTITWRATQDFDVRSAINDKLLEVGFLIAPATGSAVAAVLRGSCEEQPGGDYTPGGRGTNIRCSLELEHQRLGKVWSDTIQGTPPHHLTVGLDANAALYMAAVQQFLPTATSLCWAKEDCLDCSSRTPSNRRKSHGGKSRSFTFPAGPLRSCPRKGFTFGVKTEWSA